MISVMDLAAAAGKTPESDPDSSTRIHTPKPVSFSNGVLKRNHHSGLHNNNNHHHHSGGGGSGGGGESGVVVYKECLKNHAASLGTHAVDGCGEFMPSPTANSADPTSLKCAACGCHRNFHRREPEDSFHHTSNNITTTTNTPALEYQPHHRHHPPNPPPPPPPPPRDGGGVGGSHSSPSSPSPPPISSSYYPSAPHLLLTLSGGIPVTGNSSHSPVDHHHLTHIGNRASPAANGRKRFRTRFTQDQKGKMLELAEKLGWKMQKRDEELIIRFCNEICVEKGVFKVWMHNNKNIFGKPQIPTTGGGGGGGENNTNSIGSNGIAFVHHHHQENQEIQNEEQQESGNHFNGDNNFNGRVVCPNGSSSSS